MAPFNVTKELIYRMYLAGLLQMQEVPRSADHSASRTFYLWHVEQERTISQLTVVRMRS